MSYIVGCSLNYITYLLIGYFGFRLSPRKHKLLIGASMISVLVVGAGYRYTGIGSPIFDLLMSQLSIGLFFEDRPIHLMVVSAVVIYLTRIIHSLSVILIDVVLTATGIVSMDRIWWMGLAYSLSFLTYVLIYVRLLKKNEIYLCDIELRYEVALLVQGSIFHGLLVYAFGVMSANGTFNEGYARIMFLISMVGAMYSMVLTLKFTIKNIQSMRQNRMLQATICIQNQQYDYQLQQSALLRQFRHDQVNHMGALRELIRQRKVDEAKEYIETIWKIQEDFELRVHTGDSFLDLIINYYFDMAIKDKIEFTVLGKLTEKLPIEMVDITSLMGNVLQNAMEAVRKAKTPRIQIELLEHKSEVFIVVKNSVEKIITIRDGMIHTTKSDQENHGYGLTNIAATIKKYHGEYYIDSIVEQGEAIFKISIAIPRE